MRGGLRLLPFRGQGEVPGDGGREIVGPAVQRPAEEHVPVADRVFRPDGGVPVLHGDDGGVGPVGPVERDRMRDRDRRPYGGQGNVAVHRAREIVGFPVEQPAFELVSGACRIPWFGGGLAVGDGLRVDAAAAGRVERDEMRDGGRLVPERGERDVPGDRGVEIVGPPVEQPSGELVSVARRIRGLQDGLPVVHGDRADGCAAGRVERDRVRQPRPRSVQGEVPGDGGGEIIRFAVEQPAVEPVAVPHGVRGPVDRVPVGDGHGGDGPVVARVEGDGHHVRRP